MCYNQTLIETEEYKGYTIEIHYDMSPPNPRKDWDHVATLIGFSRNYHAGDDHHYKNAGQLFNDIAGDFIREALTHEFLKKNYGLRERIEDETDDDYYEEIEYAIDEFFEDLGYGGDTALDFALTIASKHYLIQKYTVHYDRDQAWGYAYISDADIVKEWGSLEKDDLDKARKCIKAEVEEYEAWANGHVYGYVIKGEDGEDLDDVDESCWGFYGDWDDYCLKEAKSVVDYMAKKRDEALSAVREYGYA